METKLNIAEILKNKPKGTKLYSPLFGDVYLLGVDNNIIRIKYHEEIVIFFGDGRYYNYPESEPLLFPSKEIRDWSKFAWKKGDVLVSKGRRTLHVIFEGFNDDTYTTFKGKHYLYDYANKEDYDDEKDYNDYHKEVNERIIEFEKDNVNNAQTYINIIEKRLGGKLNLETLEIEKQLEFKEGDIIVTDAVSSLCYSKCIFILKENLNTSDSSANSYIFYNVQNDMIHFNVLDEDIRRRNIHLATDSEKQQLFDALAKEGKAWDAEKKQVVDLKKKVELKPFDKVVVRCSKADRWSIDFFGYKAPNGYICTGDAWFGYCLPYDEETAKLIGTTKDVED